MKCLRLLLLTTLFIPLILSGETMYGRILDSTTLEGVSDAVVSITGLEKRVISDRDGNFSFSNIKPGNYEVIFNRIGFEQSSKEIIIPQYEPVVVSLIPKSYKLDGISITETRSQLRKTPLTYSNITGSDIKRSLHGDDLPLLMDEVPGLFAYSESGSGTGYSHIKLRGFDQKRIGVMINGIPLNDPEDHEVYWVNMPDFGESVQDIQFQRGSGASKYGIASLGGTINIETTSAGDEYSGDQSTLYTVMGSHNLRKAGMNYFASLSDDLRLNIRLSQVSSDGYRDNSATELSSFYSSLTYQAERSVTDINFYTGHEITHAAWYASWEEDLKVNHQHNPITYDNEIDDFSQPHFELHNLYRISDKMHLKNTLFYIKGKGFYEQKKYDEDLFEYGIIDTAEVMSADLIRQKWVEKNQIGYVGNISLEHHKGELMLGTYLSLFKSDHWGEVKDVLQYPQPEDFIKGMRYYRYQGDKRYITAYINENYRLLPNLFLMANLHYQNLTYEFEQKRAGNFTGENLNRYSVDYSFLNPQFGINYNLNDHINIYASAAIAHREPSDSELFDIWDGPDNLGVEPLFGEKKVIYNSEGEITVIEWSDPLVEAEHVIDYEAGLGWISDAASLKFNAYYMEFKNEIVDYGGLSDSGTAIRGNADATVHRGLEIDIKSRLSRYLQFSSSFAWSDNYFRKFSYQQWDGSEIELSGNTLGGHPELFGQAKIDFYSGKFRGFTQMQYTGSQYLDNSENSAHIVKEFTVYNVGFDYTFENFVGNTTLNLEFRLNNVFDLKYETAGYLDDGDGDWEYDDNFYFPAMGRNFSLGIRLLLI